MASSFTTPPTDRARGVLGVPELAAAERNSFMTAHSRPENPAMATFTTRVVEMIPACFELRWQAGLKSRSYLS
jgi:hypothetical protein